MFRNLFFALLTIALVFASSSLFAGGMGNPGGMGNGMGMGNPCGIGALPPCPVPVPIDGGILLLAGAGLALGARKMLRAKEE